MSNLKTEGKKLLASGVSVEDVAEKCGRAISTVQGWQRELKTDMDNAEHLSLPFNDDLATPDIPKPASDYSRSTTSAATSANQEAASNGTNVEPEEVAAENSASYNHKGIKGEESDIEDSNATQKEPTIDSPSVEISTQIWRLSTNHLNMARMLSVGMFMSPNGFNGKYYRDPSQVTPGLIPLFRNGVPEVALADAISDNKILRNCIAEITVEYLRGKIWLVKRSGEILESSAPTTIDGEVTALLVPAPLPLSYLKKLRFCSEQDQREFEARVQDDPTSSLSQIRAEIESEFCAENVSMTWPPSYDPKIASLQIDKQPVRGQVIGAVLAILFHLANRSDLCGAVYRLATSTGPDVDRAVFMQDPIMAEFPSWLKSAKIANSAPFKARMFWGVANALMDARLDNHTSNPVDYVLEYLDNLMMSESDKRKQTHLSKLIKSMKDTYGMGRGSIGDLFKTYPGPLSRALLLLCLREKCVDLLEFFHPGLKDEELLLAAILFGVREGGWRKLPLALRKPDTLADFVMQRMCNTEHQGRAQGGLAFTSDPPRPVPLRELVPSGDSWSTSLEKESLGGFALRNGWSDCIKTHVRLPKGEYHANNSQDGVEYTFQGPHDFTHYTVVKEKILSRIAQWPPLQPEIEEELREILKRESR